jgi:hypothetical protein
MAMRELDEAVSLLSAKAEGVEILPPPERGERYLDQSTIVVVPTRGQVDSRVIESWMGLMSMAPPNQKRLGPLFARGYKVEAAYNALVKRILADSHLSKARYLLTLEDDNLPPADAHLRLLETMEEGPPDGGEWAAVSGLYHTKDVNRTPLVCGDPGSLAEDGSVDFRAADKRMLAQALAQGQHVVECNGIPQGCALWRLDLFREIEPPWFVTPGDRLLVGGVLKHPREIVPEDAGKEIHKGLSQDLYFAWRARKAGKRFAVDLRVAVGHLDVATGRVY